MATGSLAQGIAYAVGVTLAGKTLDRLGYQVWTLCGDSEMAEGSVWEALDRTAPILPLRPGLPEKHTHDYVRHGTTTLFAA